MQGSSGKGPANLGEAYQMGKAALQAAGGNWLGAAKEFVQGGGGKWLMYGCGTVILVIGGLIALIVLAFLRMGEGPDTAYSRIPQPAYNLASLGKSKDEIAQEINQYLSDFYPNSLLKSNGIDFLNASSPENTGEPGINPIILMAIAEVETEYASSGNANYNSATNNPFNERQLTGECNSDGANPVGEIITFSNLGNSLTEEAKILFSDYLNCGGNSDPITNIQIKRGNDASWKSLIEGVIARIEEHTSLRYYIYAGISDEVPAPLRDVFIEVGNAVGVPPALLAAFSNRECGRLWNVPEDELINWITGNTDVDSRGCNFDNGWKCWGPAQFLDTTWGIPSGANPNNHPYPSSGSYGDQAGQKTNHIPAVSINIKDAFYGMALKVKHDSGNTGGEWTEEQVRAAAKAYCGSCTDKAACGGNYCDAVWEMYQEYSATGMRGGGGSSGNTPYQGTCGSRQECAQQLIELHNQGKIVLSSSSGDGNICGSTDGLGNTTAMQSLRDTAEGKQPWTYYNNYECRQVELHGPLLELLYKSAMSGYKLSISALLNGDHMLNSYHYQGRAADISSINGTSQQNDLALWNGYAVFVSNLGYSNIDKIWNEAGHYDHMHIEFNQ